MPMLLPKIEIINCERPFLYGVAIDVPGRTEPLFVVPFRGKSIQLAEPVDPVHVLLVGSDHQDIFMAVVDVTTGEIVRRAEHSEKHEHFALSADRRRLYAYGTYNGLRIFDTQSLAIVGFFNAALWNGDHGRLVHTRDYSWIDDSIQVGSRVRFHSEALEREYKSLGKGLRFGACFSERPTGEILIDHRQEDPLAPPGRPPRWEHGVYTLDVADGSVRRTLLPMNKADDSLSHVRAIGGAKPIAVSSNLKVLPFSQGTGARSCDAYGVMTEEVSEHKDILADGTKRFGVVLDCWPVEGALPQRWTSIVRMMSAAEFGFPPGDADTSEAYLEFEAILSAHGGDPALREHRPTKWSEAAKKHQPVFSMGGGSLDYYLHFSIRAIAVEPSGEAYWVLFRDACLRRVTATGDVGPLISFERRQFAQRGSVPISVLLDGTVRYWIGNGFVRFDPGRIDVTASRVVIPESEDGFEGESGFEAPRSHTSAFTEFVLESAKNKVDLPDWTGHSCNEALRDLAKRMSADLPSMIWADTLVFGFTVAGEPIEEAAFFQQLVDRKIPAAVGLRTLLVTYLKMIGSASEPWFKGADGIAALGPAMRALVLLDPDALDVFRLYLAKRDPEHEGYTWQTIMPDFIGAHGWRDEAALRFGINFLIVCHLRGNGVDLDTHGLLTAASEMVDAREFAEMLLAEARAHDLAKSEWDREGNDLYVPGFMSRLDPADRYQAALAHELRAMKT